MIHQAATASVARAAVSFPRPAGNARSSCSYRARSTLSAVRLDVTSSRGCRMARCRRCTRCAARRSFNSSVRLVGSLEPSEKVRTMVACADALHPHDFAGPSPRAQAFPRAALAINGLEVGPLKLHRCRAADEGPAAIVHRWQCRSARGTWPGRSGTAWARPRMGRMRRKPVG